MKYVVVLFNIFPVTKKQKSQVVLFCAEDFNDPYYFYAFSFSCKKIETPEEFLKNQREMSRKRKKKREKSFAPLGGEQYELCTPVNHLVFWEEGIRMDCAEVFSLHAQSYTIYQVIFFHQFLHP